MMLTSREKRVLLLIAKGCTNKKISAELAISLSTIKRAIRSAIKKLEAVDRASAVATALRRGYIT